MGGAAAPGDPERVVERQHERQRGPRQATVHAGRAEVDVVGDPRDDVRLERAGHRRGRDHTSTVAPATTSAAQSGP